MLVQNSHYRGITWPQLRWMFSTFSMGHFQPLSWLSLSLDYLVWGNDPSGYHLTNLILHALGAVTFFFVAKILIAQAFQLNAEKQSWTLNLAAGLSSLLFAIHPLRVESVAWVTERRDVLSGFFFFLTLYCYLRSSQISENISSSRWFALSLTAYLLSLMAKASAITLPVILLLLDFYPLRRLSGRCKSWLNPAQQKVLKEKVPFIVLAFIFAALAISAQHSAGALRPAQQYFFSYRLGQAAYGVVFYLWKSVLPIGLSPLYELPYDFAEWIPLFVLCGSLAAGITVGLFLLRNLWPAGLACWIYYLVILAPVLGFAQSGPQLVADRYSYLACTSWAILIGGGYFGAHQFARTQAHGMRLIWTMSTIILLGLVTLGSLSWKQTLVWRNDGTLWRHVIAVGPPSSIAYYNLGRNFEDENKLDIARNYYRRAVEINPANPDAQYNFARLLEKKGDLNEAIGHYKLAVQIRPNDADTHNNLGLLLAQRGELEPALKEFRDAIRIDPTYSKAYFNLGRILAQQGNLDVALQNYQQALRLAPDQSEIHLQLGDILEKQGHLVEAKEHYETAVKLNPDFAKARVALARSLLASGAKTEAEKQYQEALRRLKLQRNVASDNKKAMDQE
ncbi:MAG: tetratricopeptide repeat protein [Candidatus Binatia bacterium]